MLCSFNKKKEQVCFWVVVLEGFPCAGGDLAVNFHFYYG